MADKLATLQTFFAPLEKVMDQKKFLQAKDVLFRTALDMFWSYDRNGKLEWVRADTSSDHLWVRTEIHTRHDHNPWYWRGNPIITFHLFWSEEGNAWILSLIDREQGPRIDSTEYPFVQKIAEKVFHIEPK